MTYQSIFEKNSILTQLIDVARADGLVNIAEVSYIFWISQQLGIDQNELTKLMDKPARLVTPIDLKARVLQFQRCLTLMCIDNEITKQEIEKCKAIATDLRLNSERVSTFFDREMQDIFERTSIAYLNSHFGV